MIRVVKCKKYIGVIFAIIIAALFVPIAFLGKTYLSEVRWYLFSGAHRFVFGIIATIVLCKAYKKKIGEIFNFNNWKSALIAGSGFFLYFI